MGDASPSTPPRARSPTAMLRIKSSEKLVAAPSTKRNVRSQLELGNEELAISSAAEPAVVAAAVDRMLSRCGDEKYWSQICHAHGLLTRSIGTELTLNEAVSRGEHVLEPIFREAIEAQEVDRLNAMAMLAILRELVTRHNSDVTDTRITSAPSLPLSLVGKRVRPGEEEEEERESQDEMLGDSAAMASISLATASPASPRSTAASTPPCTPQRPRRGTGGGLPGDAITPEAVRKPVPVASPEGNKFEDQNSKRKRMRPEDGMDMPEFPTLP